MVWRKESERKRRKEGRMDSPTSGPQKDRGMMDQGEGKLLRSQDSGASGCSLIRIRSAFLVEEGRVRVPRKA